jgi:hypothetical protein
MAAGSDVPPHVVSSPVVPAESTTRSFLVDENFLLHFLSTMTDVIVEAVAEV